MRSSLSGKVPRENMSADEIASAAAAAWRQRGWAAFQVDAVLDDWLRLAITNHCNALYGERDAFRRDGQGRSDKDDGKTQTHAERARGKRG